MEFHAEVMFKTSLGVQDSNHVIFTARVDIPKKENEVYVKHEIIDLIALKFGYDPLKNPIVAREVISNGRLSYFVQFVQEASEDNGEEPY